MPRVPKASEKNTLYNAKKNSYRFERMLDSIMLDRSFPPQRQPNYSFNDDNRKIGFKCTIHKDIHTKLIDFEYKGQLNFFSDPKEFEKMINEIEELNKVINKKNIHANYNTLCDLLERCSLPQHSVYPQRLVYDYKIKKPYFLYGAVINGLSHYGKYSSDYSAMFRLWNNHDTVEYKQFLLMYFLHIHRSIEGRFNHAEANKLISDIIKQLEEYSNPVNIKKAKANAEHSDELEKEFMKSVHLDLIPLDSAEEADIIKHEEEPDDILVKNEEALSEEYMDKVEGKGDQCSKKEQHSYEKIIQREQKSLPKSDNLLLVWDDEDEPLLTEAKDPPTVSFNASHSSNHQDLESPVVSKK